jgi:hypothetical protein
MSCSRSARTTRAHASTHECAAPSPADDISSPTWQGRVGIYVPTVTVNQHPELFLDYYRPYLSKQVTDLFVYQNTTECAPTTHARSRYSSTLITPFPASPLARRRSL